MLCDKCGKNEANIHIETSINGVKKQENLCSACAQQNTLGGFNFTDLMSGMVSPNLGEEQGVRRCGNCGMTVYDLERLGKFGCAQCYGDLREHVLPMLKRIHGSTQYCGYQQTEEDKRRLAVQDLKAKLSDAILQEDYESAAELRDKIKLLEEDEAHDSLD